MTGARALCFVVALVAAACTKPAPPKKSGPAARVVSLSPSTTEAAYAVGAGDKMVGRSRYCSYPPEVTKLPQVGGYVDPSFESILDLSPDLVIGARGPAGAEITKRLESRGIVTFFPETESFANIDAMILGVGERTGQGERAKVVVAEIAAKVKAIADAVAALPKVRVLLVFGLEPLSVAGPRGFPDEMIRRAGGVNAMTEGTAYPQIGIERVIALDPDVVVNAAMAESRGKDRIAKDKPGWSQVRAVSQGRVVRLEEESVLRPGPRIADGLAVLARAIHPDVKLP